MNQFATGKLIAQKRKEHNLTQEQLAEKLGVSNKTISKWETGKCMPDYSVVRQLCEALELTIAELIDGEEATDHSVRTYDEAQILDLLQRTQELELQQKRLHGTLLMVIGFVLLALSFAFGGSRMMDFLSGLLLGLAVADLLVSVYIIGTTLRHGPTHPDNQE